jgi:hypothetical protein
MPRKFIRPECQTKEYKKWLSTVIKRCRAKCIICSKYSKICHHLDSWDWCFALRYEPRNGVVLCHHHHKEYHDKFGYGNNNRYQFDGYLRYYYNKKLEDYL